MGLFDEQADRMREQARTPEQVRGINDAQNLLNGVADGIGNFLKGPRPEPPKSSSSGGGLGGLLATAALAGGLYLFSRICSSDDDNKNSNVGK